jgi:hypothetical protein
MADMLPELAHDLRLALRLARLYRLALALGVAAMLAESALALALPWLGGQFADAVSRPEPGVLLRFLLLALLALFLSQAPLRFIATLRDGRIERIEARGAAHLRAVAEG